jgi:hypothetical protein
VQTVHTAYFPRYIHFGGAGIRPSDTWWDVNSAGTKATRVAGVLTNTLQLDHIPVRAVTSVKVDRSARHGQASGGAFATGTEWTAGDDYWVENEQDDVCLSGCLLSNSGWPIQPGTVEVTYRAGYSHDEINGHNTTSSVAADGTITTKGIDAGGIKRAVILTVMKAIHTWQAFRKNSEGQFIPGGFSAERLQDYAYTLPSEVASQTSGMIVQLPSEAIEALEEYRHWGLMRL